MGILWFLDLNIDYPQFRSQEINQQGICVKHEGGESCKFEIAEKIYAVSLNPRFPVFYYEESVSNKVFRG